MKGPFNTKASKLKLSYLRFDEEGLAQKNNDLKELTKTPLLTSKSLQDYYEILIFLVAYPSNKSELSLVEKELKRCTAFVKKNKAKCADIFSNSGLPFTPYISRYSHDCNCRLLSLPYADVSLNGFENSSIELGEALKHTLPIIEISDASAGWKNNELLDVLNIPIRNRLQFICSELAKLNNTPFIKDHFFDGLGLYTEINPKSPTLSKAFNRLNFAKPFFHSSILKKFDFNSLINSPLPVQTELSVENKTSLISVIENSLTILGRETDPITYMDSRSLRYFELDHGISVAIYGMTAERQLPLESYVGYTLFKNGLPSAYGGAWIFGEAAYFGINIFESFRGGESGFVLCQLLRVYRQAFKVNYIEVEPYQYGLNNPEGIQSGAFWFYYRFGFRPVDKSLAALAAKETIKLSKVKWYRTSEKILLSFTESNIALNFNKKTPVKVQDVALKISQLINKKYKGDRILAVAKSKELFKKNSGLNTVLNNDQEKVLEQVALWAEAYDIKKSSQLKLMVGMIFTKPDSIEEYQQLILDFFNS
jgi:hypothetical protein